MASPGFFSGGGGGGTRRTLKGYHAPDRRGSEGEGPRKLAKFHFLRQFRVLENESIFQKYQHISSKNNPCCSMQTFEKNQHILQEFLLFSKYYFEFSIFMIHYKSGEIPDDFSYQLETFIKKAQK